MVSEEKKKLVEEIRENIKNSQSVLIVSIENVSAKLFKDLKKKIGEKILIIKKSLLKKALQDSPFQELIDELENLQKNFAVIFSKKNPFDLALQLEKLKVKGKAKPGQIVEKEIVIEAGPTEFLPQSIPELSRLGLKVGIEKGKVVIKERSIIAKPGEKLSEEKANLLTKLDIKPIDIYLKPIVAVEQDKLYKNIVIEPEEKIEELKKAYSNAFSLALSINYVVKETVKILLAKAYLHALALQGINIGNQEKEEENEKKQGEKEGEKEEVKENEEKGEGKEEKENEGEGKESKEKEKEKKEEKNKEKEGQDNPA